MSSDLNEKSRPWLLPAQKNSELQAGLYLVATPIGNLADVTLRALDTLAMADIILCEDTRVTQNLLSYYGIKKPLLSYNDHNADYRRPQVLEKIKDGQIVALCSDAGMPLVSDPGYKLVKDVSDQNLYVTTLPGANAPLAALQLSAMPSNAFSFVGFLPTKSGARDGVLKTWARSLAPLIVFESARRLQKTLAAMHNILGNRQCAVVREITKLYEETQRNSLENLIQHYADNGDPRGEIVIVIDGAGATEFSNKDITVMLKDALTTMRVKDAASHVADITGRAKKEMYQMALDLNKS